MSQIFSTNFTLQNNSNTAVNKLTNKINSKKTAFEQKTLSSKDTFYSNHLISSTKGTFISINDNINGDSDFCYFDIEKYLPRGHTIVSIHAEFKSRKNYFDSSSNLPVYNNNTSDHSPLKNCFCLFDFEI